MNARHRHCLSLALALGAGAVQAQTHLSPGLWEQQVSIKSTDARTDAAAAQLQAKLAAMPPEQRKMAEQMMASHGVGAGGGVAPRTVRTCLTKEQVERDQVPQQDGHCTQQDVTHSGATTKYKFTCQGEHPVSGSGEFTAGSATAYTGHTVADIVVQGRPAQMQSDIVGKWIGSDCGDVKPMAAH